MILYLDTSALVKLYIHEEGREVVLSALDIASRTTTSTITYAETRAAFARRWRKGDLDNYDHARAVAGLDSDWTTFTRMNVTNPLAYRAGSLAQEFALRGYDAVHLATAQQCADRFGDLDFLAFDHRLNVAAQAAGLTVFGAATLDEPS